MSPSSDKQHKLVHACFNLYKFIRKERLVVHEKEIVQDWASMRYPNELNYGTPISKKSQRFHPQFRATWNLHLAKYFTRIFYHETKRFKSAEAEATWAHSISVCFSFLMKQCRNNCAEHKNKKVDLLNSKCIDHTKLRRRTEKWTLDSVFTATSAEIL